MRGDSHRNKRHDPKGGEKKASVEKRERGSGDLGGSSHPDDVCHRWPGPTLAPNLPVSLRVNEVTAWTGVPEETVRKALGHELPVVRLNQKVLVVMMEDLLAWLMKHREGYDTLTEASNPATMMMPTVSQSADLATISKRCDHLFDE